MDCFWSLTQLVTVGHVQKKQVTSKRVYGISFFSFFERNYGKTLGLPEFYCQKGDTAKYIEIVQMVAD